MSVIDETVGTEDIGEAEASIRRVYPRGSIRESRTPFAFRQQVRGDERASLARFIISSWTDIQVDFDRILTVGRVRGGAYRATSNGTEVDPTGPFLLRPGQGRSQSEGLDLLTVNLSEQALERFAESWSGTRGPRLRFPGVAPLDGRRAVFWDRTVRYVESVFDDPVLLANDLLRNAAVDTLLAAAFTSFPVDIAAGTRSSDQALPSAVRRALAHIDDNADRAVSVEEIAAAARMSVRGLQTAFRRHLDTTPGTALKEARLSAVHEELVRTAPGAARVADIAHRFGFAHLGRFAAEYRARFGELPKETLRR